MGVKCDFYQALNHSLNSNIFTRSDIEKKRPYTLHRAASHMILLFGTRGKEYVISQVLVQVESHKRIAVVDIRDGTNAMSGLTTYLVTSSKTKNKILTVFKKEPSRCYPIQSQRRKSEPTFIIHNHLPTQYQLVQSSVMGSYQNKHY